MTSDRAAAGMALTSAIEVFGEHDLRALTEQACAVLEQMAARRA
ncbi:MAG: hypothetical protein WDN45_08555 [Caulobacteraceae bacterium]